MTYDINILSIRTWWAEMSGAEHVFWGISIVFSVLFFFQFVLSLLGVDFDGDEETHHPSSEVFQLFSVRSGIAFFMFFGWSGTFMLSKGESLSMALMAALGTGTVALFLIAYFSYWLTITDDITEFAADEILYREGEVYLTVPGNREGQGKIQLQLGDSIHEIDAITEHLTTLAVGTRIRVTHIVDKDLLMIEPIKRLQ